jgi:hypothetical protein
VDGSDQLSSGRHKDWLQLIGSGRGLLAETIDHQLQCIVDEEPELIAAASTK